MLDTCNVVTTSSTPTTDPVTNIDTYPETVIYTGKCRVRPYLQSRSDAAFGEQQVQLLSHLVSLPMSATAVVPDAVVVVTASTDASLVSKRLRVRTIARGSDVTARRLACEETA